MSLTMLYFAVGGVVNTTYTFPAGKNYTGGEAYFYTVEHIDMALFDGRPAIAWDIAITPSNASFVLTFKNPAVSLTIRLCNGAMRMA